MTDNTGKLRIEENDKDISIWVDFGDGKKSVRIGLISSKPLLRIPGPIVTDEQVEDIKASIERIRANEEKLHCAHGTCNRRRRI